MNFNNYKIIISKWAKSFSFSTILLYIPEATCKSEHHIQRISFTRSSAHVFKSTAPFNGEALSFRRRHERILGLLSISRVISDRFILRQVCFRCVIFPCIQGMLFCRWPGASLIVIKGHKHLHECAYIGDNSSEELDELMEAIKEGTYVAPNNRTSEKPKGEKAPANEPDLMKRHREDVEFHHPIHKNSSSKHTINKIVDTTDVSDPKVIKQILDALQEKTNRKVKNVSLIMKDHQHIKRNSTIAKDEVNNVNIEHSVHEKNTTNNSQEVLKDIIKKLEAMGEKGSDILKKVNNQFKNKPNQKNVDNHILNVVGRHYSKPAVDFADSIDNARRRKRDLIIQTAMASQLVDDDEHNDQGIEEVNFIIVLTCQHKKINDSFLGIYTRWNC